jgi:hypothetical protein
MNKPTIKVSLLILVVISHAPATCMRMIFFYYNFIRLFTFLFFILFSHFSKYKSDIQATIQSVNQSINQSFEHAKKIRKIKH